MVSSFATSFGTITKKPTVLVKATTTNGIIGWGEGAALPFPYYKADTHETTYLALQKYIVPQALNIEFRTPEDFRELYSHNVIGHNFAKTAIETAIWMIYSISENKTLSKLLGGTKYKIPVGESLGIQSSVEETLAEVKLRKEEGYRRTKVKVKPKWDVNIVKAIRKEFGNIDLMVDGNSAYTLKDVKTFKELDEFNLTMIEQPLAHDDIIDHATLQKKIKTPICLDESILSAEDARKAIEIGACKIINIKPGRVGGLVESKKIHDVCKKNKIGVWCGGMLETGIGRAFNIAVSSLPNYKYPNDMSPVNIFYKDDLVKDSFVVDKNGYVTVPQVPGLGFEIDENKIEKYTKRESRFI